MRKTFPPVERFLIPFDHLQVEFLMKVNPLVKKMVQRTCYFGNSVVQMQLAFILPQIRLLKFITTNGALPKGAPALQSCIHANTVQIRNEAVDNVSN
jgi:hypothetical protein